jgi:hypothetical protein
MPGRTGRLNGAAFYRPGVRGPMQTSHMRARPLA